MSDVNANRGSGIGSIAFIALGLVQLVLALIALILGAAFVLSLLGANPESGFASWIYDKSASIMTPFNGIFDPITLSNSTTIQPSLLVALVVYLVIAGVVGAISMRLRNV